MRSHHYKVLKGKMKKKYVLFKNKNVNVQMKHTQSRKKQLQQANPKNPKKEKSVVRHEISEKCEMEMKQNIKMFALTFNPAKLRVS